MKYPHLPKKYNRNKRILTDRQLELAKKMIKTMSQKKVAFFFGVSPMAIMPHISDKYRKMHRNATKNWNERNFERVNEYKKNANNKRYILKNKLFPDEMKKARKIAREKIGKDYFNKKVKEYRMKYPNKRKEADRIYYLKNRTTILEKRKKGAKNK